MPRRVHAVAGGLLALSVLCGPACSHSQQITYAHAEFGYVDFGVSHHSTMSSGFLASNTDSVLAIGSAADVELGPTGAPVDRAWRVRSHDTLELCLGPAGAGTAACTVATFPGEAPATPLVLMDPYNFGGVAHSKATSSWNGTSFTYTERFSGTVVDTNVLTRTTRRFVVWIVPPSPEPAPVYACYLEGATPRCEQAKLGATPLRATRGLALHTLVTGGMRTSVAWLADAAGIVRCESSDAAPSPRCARARRSHQPHKE